MNNDLEQYAENNFTDLELEGMAHGNNPVANAYRELLAFRLAAKQANPVGFTSMRWLETRDKVEAYTAEDLFDEKYGKYGMKSVPLYTTPPANSPAIPDGWKLVPIEMTDDIGEAIAKQARCCGGIALDIYDAALAAAPKPESE